MFSSVETRLTVLVGVAVALGFVLVVSFHAGQHERSIMRQNERTVQLVTESVIEGLETVMLAGHADVAEQFAAGLKNVAGVRDFRIIRTSGEEAFLDNATIRRVNEARGEADFSLRHEERSVAVLRPTDPHLTEAVRLRRFVRYYEERDGEPMLTFLWPVLNGKECTRCHGRDHEVRGLLKLSTSMNSVRDEVTQLRLQSGSIMVVVLLIMVVVLRGVLRRIVRPIRRVSDAMGRVSAGELAIEVPVLGGDELAQMATSFNRLLVELRETHAGFRAEHDKLQTIIHGSRDGIVVTDGRARIVLVNPAAERLLGKPAARIAGEGFEALFDDPEGMRRWLERSLPDPEGVFFNGRHLSVALAVIRSDDGRLVGQTAMIRDVTEERIAEQKLRAMSSTDGLTGLANRRLLDEVLQTEVRRSLRTGRPLTVLIFDVDHFKAFNDTHGHAQGDEVLKEVGRVAERCIRTVDLACRYGGEEFVVVLTETALEGALMLAERLRGQIEAMRVSGLTVTASIGVASLHDADLRTVERLLERADQALYAAKRGGRNRVEAAKRSPP